MPRNSPAASSLLRPLLVLLLLFPGPLTGAQEPDLSGGPGGSFPDMAGPAAGEPDPEETGVPAPGFVEPPAEEPLPPPRWFRSNAAGMALEETPSRLAALRNEYALGLDYLPPGGLPEVLASRYEAPWRVEVRILYKEGRETRRQWIFRDAGGAARLVAVFDQDLLNPPGAEPLSSAEPVADPAAEPSAVPETEPEAGDEAPVEAAEAAEAGDEEAGIGEAVETAGEAPGERPPALTGFIEMYNEEGQIITEHLFREEGEESITGFFYHRGRLIRAELRRKDPAGDGETVPVYTDQYRYNRAASLRAVERTYHQGAEAASPVSLRFPHMVLNAAADKDFVPPPASFLSSFPEEYFIGEGYRVVYTTDSRGRVLTETRQDDNGTVILELINTWAGDRLSSVRLKAGDDERLTEYEYDSQGDRIIERNYRRGILERLVRTSGDREVEELYMNGVVILRAIWEEGRKISEERVRSGP
jgi:hypothetical protein